MEKKQQPGKRILMSALGVVICGVSVGMFKHAALGVDPLRSALRRSSTSFCSAISRSFPSRAWRGSCHPRLSASAF